MSYTRVFDNPYPGGWQSAPSVATPITAAALQEHTDAIEHIEDYLASGGGGGGGGSSVSWNQIKQSGEKIAEISIDGTTTNVYASNGGGSTVAWNQIVGSGTKIATVTINGSATDVYAPTSGGGGSTSWGQITGTLSNQTDLNTALGNKVDKVTGKGLSTNDYTTDEKTKLAGIADNANNYSLPTASTTTLGGVKVDGTTVTISNGVISASGCSSEYYEQTQYVGNESDTSYTFTRAGGFNSLAIDVYTNIFGYNPKNITMSGNNCIVTFPPIRISSESDEEVFAVSCTCRIYVK